MRRFDLVLGAALALAFAMGGFCAWVWIHDGAKGFIFCVGGLLLGPALEARRG